LWLFAILENYHLASCHLKKQLFSKLNLWRVGPIQFEAVSNFSEPFSNLARFHVFDLLDILRMITSSFDIFSFI